MAYVEPATVWAPKASIRSVEVLYNAGPREWSAARVNWDEKDRVGIRWNGADDVPGIGHPQARGNATWFILPEQLEGVVLDKIEELTNSGPGGLQAGGLQERYAEMVKRVWLSMANCAKQWPINSQPLRRSVCVPKLASCLHPMLPLKKAPFFCTWAFDGETTYPSERG